MGPVSTGPCLHPTHEGLGYRAFVPDRIQGDAVFSAYVIRGPVQDHVSPSIARSIVPPIKSRAGLAAVKAWPGYNAPCVASTVPASLDRGCARRSAKLWSGRRNILGRTKKRGVRYACLLTSKAPYKDGLSSSRNPSSSQSPMGIASLHPSYACFNCLFDVFGGGHCTNIASKSLPQSRAKRVGWAKARLRRAPIQFHQQRWARLRFAHPALAAGYD